MATNGRVDDWGIRSLPPGEMVVRPTAETDPREGDGFIHIRLNQTKNTKTWCDCPLLPHPLLSTSRVSPVLVNKCTDYCYVLHV